jgi:dienelactone hydrolase
MRRPWIGVAIQIAVMAGLAAPARAQAPMAPDLAFPTAAEAPSAVTKPRMALMKPDGDGPFPAIVFTHQCRGLNPAMLGHAKEAVRRGYVALLTDSFGPRGVETVCYGPRNGVNFLRGARDALQAAEHLRSLPYVDGDRVMQAGFSWGAMIGLLASGKGFLERQNLGRGIAAVASIYPGCFTITTPVRTFEMFNPPIAQPLLVLMGSADTETPPSDCVPKLQAAQQAGAPITFHVYDGATHCWDCKFADGHSRIDIRGNKVSYRYDEAATRDTVERIFTFFAKVAAEAKDRKSDK